MAENEPIDISKKYVDFYATPTVTKSRSYIHIPAKLISLKKIDPSKTYRVILIPVEAEEQN